MNEKANRKHGNQRNSARLSRTAKLGQSLDLINTPLRRSVNERRRIWAPPRCAISRLTRPATSSRRAFTLMEIMVVLVVIGILAATIIPQFIGTTKEAKVNAAKANVSELESAMERLYIHLDRYPTTEEGLKALLEAPAGEEKKWRGPYIKLLRPDPWGNAYQYRSPGTHHPTSFDLWSRGADGADGGEGDAADLGNWQ